MAWLQAQVSFAGGMNQDEPMHLLKNTESWSIQNGFLDDIGAVRMRGPILAAVSNPQGGQAGALIGVVDRGNDTYRGYALLTNGAAGFQDGNNFLPLGGTNTMVSFDPYAFPGVVVGGTPVSLRCPPSVMRVDPQSRHQHPIQVGPVLVFCGFNRGVQDVYPANNFFVTGADMILPDYGGGSTLTVTALSNVITGFNAPEMTHIGTYGILEMSNAGGNIAYFIVSGQSGNTVTVYPTPAISASYTSWAYRAMKASDNSVNPHNWGAQCAYQNRLVIGNVGYVLGGAIQRYQNRIHWSELPTNTQFNLAAGAGPDTTHTYDGLAWAMDGKTFAGNQLDLQHVGEIVALQPISETQLLVLGSKDAVTINGTISSFSASFFERPVPHAYGCISGLSVARTPMGIMFASPDGVCVYDGGRMHNLTEGRLQNLYRSLTYGVKSMPIYGFYFRDHYFLINPGSFFWAFNVITKSWVTLATGGFAPGHTIVTPNGFVAIGAGGLNSNGIGLNQGISAAQVLRMDTMFPEALTNLGSAYPAPYTALDVSSSLYPYVMTIVTRAFTQGDGLQLKRWRRVKFMTKNQSPASQWWTFLYGASISLGSGVVLANPVVDTPAGAVWNARFDHLTENTISPAIYYIIKFGPGANAVITAFPELLGIAHEFLPMSAGRTV